MPDSLASLDATAQADLVRRGEVSPAELVEAARSRIEAVNPEINAVIHSLAEKAAAAAVASDLADGPFRGVPFLVKDAVCHTSGDPYHCGMQFLKDREWTAETDTYLAQKFRRAGFVFVGKTNTPELATSVTTEPLAYGPTRNPWNVAHSTGGSSGGSAAAVAAGLAPVAHANDMGGSIRAPASECGLVGLKATRARTSLGPGFGEFWGPLTHEGVVTRSVRDTAAALDAIAGPMPGDPYTAPAPARPFVAEVGADPGALSVGIRTSATPGMPVVDAEIVAAVEAVGRLLEQLGHRVESGGPTALDDDVNRGFFPVFASAVARDLDRWSERTGDPIGATDVEPMNWTTAEIGRTVSGPAYLEAVEQLQADSRRLAAWWKDHDLLVTPTIGVLPPELGVMAPAVPIERSLLVMAQITQFLMPWNITGQPAISLPLGESVSGLPIGVQMVAATG
ncbi:MAG: amidase, partial [Acidimicrobiia bacterium]